MRRLCSKVAAAAEDTQHTQPPVISNAVPTARELEALMDSAQAALHRSGHVLATRHDMQ